MQTKENHVTCQSGGSSQTLAYCISYTILHCAEQIVSPEQVTATCLTYWSCRFRWDPCTPCKVASWKSSWKQNIPDARNKSIIVSSLMISMRPDVCFLISPAKWPKKHWKLNVIYQTQFITILQFARFFQPWTFWAKEFFPSASLISHMVQHPGWGPPSALQLSI